MPKKIKGNLPRATPEEAKKIVDFLDKVIVQYDGIYQDLEPAIGAYLFARHVGWKPLVLVHNKRTIRKFEEILGIEFRKEFDPAGPDCERSNAYRFAMKLSNFWKAVSGEAKIEGRNQLD